ncbi:uncharacterized protein PV09_05045 [Verruconis gallopava]|uniref:Cytoplasmic tRNA 2-thiolation protein 2 n=1 Tax=Verruconis gallopava TaxID=253628 RepID=A0A0D2AAE0_9PEZI|nr:uncharacterized protein PV09_05045 [Verruconis gallopava]KIW03738.1 hypothetical protein PV09_05045 [Verruconis gallopava]
MRAEHLGQLCKRCSVHEATLTVRNEPLCKECFSKYIHTKVVKRMEAFRTRHASATQERKLLLPISLGVSSVTLLHILDRHLQGQKQKTGRVGFSLHVLYVRSPERTDDLAIKFNAVKEAYPNHTFSMIDLETLFTEKENLRTILDSLPSATSAADVLSILQKRLAVEFAKLHSCEGILWGDSTTKLAEKVLVETSKGRGFSLPWQVGDGASPYSIPFYYPMRDVLKKELIAHSRLTDPPLALLMDTRVFETTQAPPSAKDTTIDVVMKGYFEDVEQSFPSVISNVVRTTEKLIAPKAKEDVARCRLCVLPLPEGRSGVRDWGGHQEEQNEPDPGTRLCYGCSRSIPERLIPLLP